jgi:hypothetical protein
VGRDKDDEVKVYVTLAKANVTAPYLTFAIVPIGGPTAVYGDTEVLEDFEVAVASWGRDSLEAWNIADVADDALKRGDYSFEPYELIGINRTTTPHELPDRDTDLRQVVVRYRFMIGR